MCFYSAALTVKQLKELCRKHGLKVTGTKATLSLRLENADRMLRRPREEMPGQFLFILVGM